MLRWAVAVQRALGPAAPGRADDQHHETDDHDQTAERADAEPHEHAADRVADRTRDDHGRRVGFDGSVPQAQLVQTASSARRTPSEPVYTAEPRVIVSFFDVYDTGTSVPSGARTVTDSGGIRTVGPSCDDPKIERVPVRWYTV